jgi:hypothetical protein
MGRKRWTNRLTVEDCLPLDVKSFRLAGTFAYPPGTTGTIWWTTPYGVELGRVEYATQNHADGLAICIRRRYPLDECLIPLTTTRPRLGGARFWFVCPCGRRVGRLYLPAGQSVFGCRTCYNLTYQSAQTHDKRRDALMRDPVALRAALDSKNPRTYLLGAAAATQLMERPLRKRGW